MLPRSRLLVGGIAGLDLLQLLLPVRAVSWSVFKAAVLGGAPVAFNEVDAHVAAGLALEPGVAASGVGELSEDVQGGGLTV